MDEQTQIRQALGAFPQARIGVLGDLMADRFIYGKASRISPEAPVPVVHITHRTTQPGGAANVGNNVLSMGGTLSLFGVLGDDEAGGEIRGLLEERGARMDGVVSVGGRPSTVKTRVVAQNQQVVRYDEETTADIDQPTRDCLLASVRHALPQLDILLLSDYAKGVLTEELAASLMAAAHEAGVPVVVDPKPGNITRYQGADLVKPNLSEAMALFGHDAAGNLRDMESVCRHVQEMAGCRQVIVTAGQEGMHVLDGEGSYRHLPGMPREVFDVAGAGDSTLAAIAMALAGGADLFVAARIGNLAGSIAVGHLGVTAVRLEEMMKELEEFLG
ncbi:MAG: bifunctional hydroxymethylpyrimidine kinase/phosphomethylpyrimidine kinase [Planctomycetales bacterium]|nr:bifunctional hydroxymethylpyrimidine kinase/phosphomethylpyrimidine kinase [bacterium]UNM07422.1 MAG: bifunctional hydroxymethylpyrimidine kinase/phosphomethylpyrimidine kinase [Planctomycetales bacterium]